MYSYKDFLAKKKQSNKSADYVLALGDDNAELKSAYPTLLVYPGPCYILQRFGTTQAMYALLIGNEEFESNNLSELEPHLYAWYASEHIATVKDLKLLAERVLVEEWGTGQQIRLENQFFDSAKGLGFEDDEEWESFSLKARTEEMIDYVFAQIEGQRS